VLRARRRSSEPRQKSVEERRRAALAATRELRERLFVYRPALDYKRTTKMTLTPSRYKESVLLARRSPRSPHTPRASALSCAPDLTRLATSSLRPPARLSPQHVNGTFESHNTRRKSTQKKSFTATCPKSTKTRPTPPQLGPLTHAARAPGTIRHICTRIVGYVCKRRKIPSRSCHFSRMRERQRIKRRARTNTRMASERSRTLRVGERNELLILVVEVRRHNVAVEARYAAILRGAVEQAIQVRLL
jgi:hypothetical protein